MMIRPFSQIPNFFVRSGSKFGKSGFSIEPTFFRKWRIARLQTAMKIRCDYAPEKKGSDLPTTSYTQPELQKRIRDALYTYRADVEKFLIQLAESMYVKRKIALLDIAVE